ncbi:MAG: hypothetical protein DME26_08245, partial [Verrucomicrobia bacterium]
MTVENKSTRTLRGPFVLVVDSFTGTSGPQFTDGNAGAPSPKPFYDLSAAVLDAELAPGERSLPRMLTLGVGVGTPSLATKVFTQPQRLPKALALVRSLDEAGQPLTDVRVDESGPLGSKTNFTDSVFGVATVGQAEGNHAWKFSKTNYLPVWRQQVLNASNVTVIPGARLTRRATNSVIVTPIAGALASVRGGSIQANFTPGTFSQAASITFTPLTAQTLPALLPAGWSPLQSFWLEMSVEPLKPVGLNLRPSGPISTIETAALARWNETALHWETTQIVPGNGTNGLSVSVSSSGAYSLLIGDAAPLAPPAPQVGAELRASSAAMPNVAMLAASGTVDPASSPASRAAEMVTATAAVVVTNNSGPMPSGLILRGNVAESYRLSDGTRRQPPQYEHFIVGYQRPGDSALSTLRAEFPMRPLLLFGSEELAEASVKVDVLAPTPFTGGVIGSEGGLVASDGVRVLAGAGDLVSDQAIELRILDPANFADLVKNNITVLAGFELSVAGVASGRQLTARVEPPPTNGLLVLARVLYDRGLYGLQPLERLASDS